jgi:hypothetical protein
MAAVESPVEAPGSGIGDGAWFWASGRSRFPHGLPPAHCVMAALSDARRSSVSGQPWRVILVLGSPSLPQKSTLCFQTEDRSIAHLSPWSQCSMAAMSEDRRSSREGAPAGNAPREPLNAPSFPRFLGLLLPHL